MASTIRELLAARPDPLGVLTTSAGVVARAGHVKLDRASVRRTADQLAASEIRPPGWNFEYHYFDGTGRTVHYIFLLDALNFCFWGAPKWTIEYNGARLDGYWALAAALKRAAEDAPEILDPRTWAALDPADLAYVLRGDGEIPLMLERWRNVRELGRVLVEHWRADATTLVAAAARDAPRLARSVADNFASFADITLLGQRQVFFFKRAQILVADLAGSFGGRDWGEFTNLDVLTAFADYKLPQILRAWGILQYDEALARRVDARRELARDGAEEIEIRAATLWAVELLRQELEVRGRKLSSVEMDWFLWETSQGARQGMKPYHRVRTVYY